MLITKTNCLCLAGINKSSTMENTDKLEGESSVGSVDKIIQSVKQRHEEEFFLMEESYK